MIFSFDKAYPDGLIAVLCYHFQPMRIQNTWLGDAARMELLKASIRVIEEDQLLLRTRNAGAKLLQGIEKLAVSISELKCFHKGLCTSSIES